LQKYKELQTKKITKMSSVRNLKKDLEFVSNELIYDCYTYQLLYKKNQNEVNLMIDNIRKNYFDSIAQVKIDKKTKTTKEIKTHYNGIIKNFQTNINEITLKLDALEK